MQKKHKGRQPSEGPPPEFFSPSAVIEEPTFDGNHFLVQLKSSSLKNAELQSSINSVCIHAHPLAVLDLQEFAKTCFISELDIFFKLRSFDSTELAWHLVLFINSYDSAGVT